MSNIDQLFIEYIDYISDYREFSEKTIINYQSKYKILSKLFSKEGVTDIEQLDRRRIIEYLQNMKIKYTKSTMKGFITIIRNLLKYCNHVGIGCVNYKAIDYIKPDIRHIEAVPDDIVDIMLQHAEKEKNILIKKRNIILILILYETGCRIGEIVNIKISDINKDGSIEVIGKRCKKRTVYISQKTIAIIDSHIKDRSDKIEWLFTSFSSNYERKQILIANLQRILQKYSQKEGIKCYSPHSYRRAFASRGLREGATVIEMSRALGHSSLNTLLYYAEVSKNDLAKQYWKLQYKGHYGYVEGSHGKHKRIISQ